MRFFLTLSGHIDAPEGSRLGEAGTTLILPDGTEVGPDPLLFKHVGGGMYDQIDEDGIGCAVELHARTLEDADV